MLALFDFHQRFAGGLSSIKRLLDLGGWDITEVAVETLRATPVHPSERCQHEVLDRFPRARACGAADEFGLVISVHRLGESFTTSYGRELTARVAVTAQILVVGAPQIFIASKRT